MVSLPRFGSLWAFGPSAHRAHASLRAFGHSKRLRAAGAGRPAPMAQAVGAGTRLPRRERAHAAGPLPTGTRSMARRGQLRGAGRRVSCIPVAQSFALPRRSRSWFRCPASGRFGPSAQQPTGLTLPFAPLDTRNARAQRGRGRPAPMARAVGAGTRLPRRERAHAAGLLPTGTRSMARRGQPQGAARRVSCSRLLNHSRFPDGRAHGFAAPLRVALGLRPKCPQGTRFPARLSGARNARVACVRRKDGRCHSERSKGRDPLT